MTSSTPPDASLFGAVQVGYVVVESNRLEDWRRFLQQGVGLHLQDQSNDLLAFRMDTHLRRCIVCRGPAEDVVAIGLQVRNPAALSTLLGRLAARGIRTETASPAEAAARGTTALVRLRGPKDLALELFTEAITTPAPLQMLSSGFVTGGAGMGHVAVTTRRPEAMCRFWQEMFDARLSDQVSQRLSGLMLDVAFLRFNERHHSMAIAALRSHPRIDPVRTRVQHLNLLALTLEDVSSAFERLQALGYEMAHEIGQHPNDREVSFYVVSPSGFEIELGCGALTVDESCWKPAHYDAISVWGHKPERSGLHRTFAINAGNFGRGLRSLFAHEYSPL